MKKSYPPKALMLLLVLTVCGLLAANALINYFYTPPPVFVAPSCGPGTQLATVFTGAEAQAGTVTSVSNPANALGPIDETFASLNTNAELTLDLGTEYAAGEIILIKYETTNTNGPMQVLVSTADTGPFTNILQLSPSTSAVTQEIVLPQNARYVQLTTTVQAFLLDAVVHVVFSCENEQVPSCASGELLISYEVGAMATSNEQGTITNAANLVGTYDGTLTSIGANASVDLDLGNTLLAGDILTLYHDINADRTVQVSVAATSSGPFSNIGYAVSTGDLATTNFVLPIATQFVRLANTTSSAFSADAIVYQQYNCVSDATPTCTGNEELVDMEQGATAVEATTGTVSNDSDATGVRDNSVATISASSSLTLDMGSAIMAGNTIRIYYDAANTTAPLQVETATTGVGTYTNIGQVMPSTSNSSVDILLPLDMQFIRLSTTTTAFDIDVVTALMQTCLEEQVFSCAANEATLEYTSGAQVVISQTGTVTNPDNALQKINGATATIAANSTLVVDLGDEIPAGSRLTLTYNSNNTTSFMLVGASTSSTGPFTTVKTIDPNTTSNSINFLTTVNTRYIEFGTMGTQYLVDAITRQVGLCFPIVDQSCPSGQIQVSYPVGLAATGATTGTITSPANIIGTPNNTETQINANSSVVVDFGQVLPFCTYLTFHYRADNGSAPLNVWISTNAAGPFSNIASVPISTSSTTYQVVIPEAAQYLLLDTDAQRFYIDAVTFQDENCVNDPTATCAAGEVAIDIAEGMTNATQTSGSVTNPGNAIGTYDGLRATIAANAALSGEFAAPLTEGTQLTLTYRSNNNTAPLQVSIATSAAGPYTNIGQVAASTTVTTDTLRIPFAAQYFRYETNATQFELDATTFANTNCVTPTLPSCSAGDVLATSETGLTSVTNQTGSVTNPTNMEGLANGAYAQINANSSLTTDWGAVISAGTQVTLNYYSNSTTSPLQMLVSTSAGGPFTNIGTVEGTTTQSSQHSFLLPVDAQFLQLATTTPTVFFIDAATHQAGTCLTSPAPSCNSGETLVGYAQGASSVVSTSGTVTNPNNSLGVANGTNTTISANAVMVLDLGGSMPAGTALELTYSSNNLTGPLQLSVGSNSAGPFSNVAQIAPMTTTFSTQSVILPQAAQYVELTSPASTQYLLDALTYSAYSCLTPQEPSCTPEQTLVTTFIGATSVAGTPVSVTNPNNALGDYNGTEATMAVNGEIILDLGASQAAGTVLTTHYRSNNTTNPLLVSIASSAAGPFTDIAQFPATTTATSQAATLPQAGQFVRFQTGPSTIQYLDAVVYPDYNCITITPVECVAGQTLIETTLGAVAVGMTNGTVTTETQVLGIKDNLSATLNANSDMIIDLGTSLPIGTRLRLYYRSNNTNAPLQFAVSNTEASGYTTLAQVPPSVTATDGTITLTSAARYVRLATNATIFYPDAITYLQETCVPLVDRSCDPGFRSVPVMEGATAVVTTVGTVTNSANALGLYNGTTASLPTGAIITLDLGMTLSGTDPLFIYYESNIANGHAEVRASTSSTGPFEIVGYLEASTDPTVHTIELPIAAQYLEIESRGFTLSLDATTFDRYECVPYDGVAGCVFYDADNDGSNDNEIGVGGVVVKLYDVDGNLVEETTSATGQGLAPLGSFEFIDLDPGQRYRIEFEPLTSSGLFPSAVGTDNNSSVQFVFGGSDMHCFGVYQPDLFCTVEDNPRIAIAQGLLSGGQHSVRSWRYYDRTPVSGTSFNGQVPDSRELDVLYSETGALFGLTSVRGKNWVIGGALASDNTVPFPIGPEGTGALYILDYDDVANATQNYVGYKHLINLEDLGIDLSNQNPANAATNQFGELGIGSIDLSPDGNTLYALNMGNGNLILIDVTGLDYHNLPATAPSSASEIAIPAALKNCGGSQFRPVALKVYNKRIYIGGVCDGTDGGTLSAKLINYDPATGQWAEDLSFPIDFESGGIGSTGADPVAWDNFASSSNNQPLFADIAVDGNGDFHIGFLNRYVMLGATSQTQAGFFLRTYRDASGQLQIENAGVAGPYTGARFTYTPAATTDGPGGDWFYAQNAIYGAHPYSYNGGMFIKPGEMDIVTGHVDPAQSFSNGASYYDIYTGLPTYNAVMQLGVSKVARITGGEQVCEAIPEMEIGNLVWYDNDGDGIQDANDQGIANVTLNLFADTDLDGEPDGGVLASTTTDENGNYLFTSANVADGDPVTPGDQSGIQPNTGYVIQIASSDWDNGMGVNELAEGILTDSNIGGTGQPDVRDNDAVLAGAMNIPTIALVTGDLGENNHTFDFGIEPPTFDLALIITQTPGEPALVSPGDPTSFDITVTNQGEADAFDIDLATYFETSEIDYTSIPNLILTSTNGATLNVADNGSGSFTLDMLASGDEVVITVIYTVDPTFMGNDIIVDAEITGGARTDGGIDAVDIDSNPNDDATNPSELGNDNIITDNDTGDTRDDDDFEDDFDPVQILIDRCELMITNIMTVCNSSTDFTLTFNVEWFYPAVTTESIVVTLNGTPIPGSGFVPATASGTQSFTVTMNPASTGNVLTATFDHDMACTATELIDFIIDDSCPPEPPILQCITTDNVDGTYETGDEITIYADYNQVLENGSAIEITLDAGPTVLLQHLGEAIGGTISADPTYDPGANNVPYAMAVQPDGKIIIGGDFSQVDGISRSRIARLNTDGTLDTDFGTTAGSINNRVLDIAIQPDGKIIIVGFFTSVNGSTRRYIARLEADGSVDNTFDPNANNNIYAVALQDNGQMIVGGDFSQIDGVNRTRIARLNDDGTIDASFGILNNGADNRVEDIAIQSDGKVVLVGHFGNVNSTASLRVARLETDGTIDGTYTNPNANNVPYVVALQADDKAIIGGDFSAVGGGNRTRLARLNTDGTLDTSFGVLNDGANNRVEDIDIQGDGNIIVGGHFTAINGTTRNRIARLTPDGLADPTFDPSTGASNEIYSLVIQEDGRIVVGGNFSSFNGTSRTRLARLDGDDNVAATPDMRLCGVYTVGASDVSSDLTVTAISNANVVGQLGTSTDTNIPAGQNLGDKHDLVINLFDLALTKTLATGQASSVLAGAEVIFTITVYNQGGIGVADIDITDYLPTNTSYSAAGSTNSGALTSTLANTIALTNNGNGTFQLDTLASGDNISFDIGITIDGAAMGTVTNNAEIVGTSSGEDADSPLADISGSSDDVTELATNDDIDDEAPGTPGTMDNAADEDDWDLEQITIIPPTPPTIQCITTTNADGTYMTGDEIIIYADYDQVLEAGSSIDITLDAGPTITLSHLNASIGGIISADPTYDLGANNVPYAMAVQPDGKIIIGGDFSQVDGISRSRIARLNTDGTLDTDFGTTTGSINNRVLDIAIQPDGKIIIVGFFTSVNGSTRRYIARLEADGSVDNTFDPNANNNIYAVALQDNGQMIVGGDFSQIDGVNRTRIARLNDDGTIDASFGILNNGADNRVEDIAIQSDGKIVLVGHFGNVNSTASLRVARLETDGTIDGTYTNPNANNVPYVVVLQDDDKAIIGGDFSAVGGGNRTRLARLNTDGTLDTSFGVLNDGANNRVEDIDIQGDGNIIVGGHFTAINGTTRNRIARLTPDGLADPTFDPSTGASNEIYSLVIQEDGRIVVGGNFSSFNGTSRTRLARLDGDDNVAATDDMRLCGTYTVGAGEFSNDLTVTSISNANVVGELGTSTDTSIPVGNNLGDKHDLVINCSLEIDPTSIVINCSNNGFNYTIDFDVIYGSAVGNTIEVTVDGVAQPAFTPTMTTGTQSYTGVAISTLGYNKLIEANFAGVGGCSDLQSIDLIPSTACVEPCVDAPGVIGGNVFNDNDNDGTDAGDSELGQENVLVQVFDCDGNLACETYTNVNGDWSCDGLTDTEQYRVEFSTPLHDYLQPSYAGTDNGTNVQFVTAPSCQLGYGVIDRTVYCPDMPMPRLVVPCYVNGPAGSGSVNDVLVSWDYDAISSGGNKATEAGKAQIGSTWGVDYSRDREEIYAAAFLKRHVGMGPNGLGAIYRIDPTQAANGTLLINIPDVGTIPDDATRGLVSETGTSLDAEAFAKVGKTGLGGIAMTADEQFLYVVNLNNRNIYQVDIDNASIVNTIATPDPGCTGGDYRPFGLTIYQGSLYLGTVCDASTSNDRDDLEASVWRMSLATNTFEPGPFLTVPLDYNRDPAAIQNAFTGAAGETPTVHSAKWYPWDDTYTPEEFNQWSQTGSVNVSHPVPVLSDIAFDNEGNMILAFMDRTGHQLGDNNLRPDGVATPLIDNLSGGDLLSVTQNTDGTWTLESLEFPPSMTVTEFFGGEDFTGFHEELSMGSVAYRVPTDEIIGTMVDPLNAFFSGGTRRLSLTDGSFINGYQLYVTGDNAIPFFGKANGLGGMVITCAELPVQIGNYVWEDADQDGVQDPCEAPIQGVPVSLYNKDTGMFEDVQTTGADGEYYFDDVAQNTNYAIVFGYDHTSTATDGLWNTTDGELIVNGSIYTLTTADADGTNPLGPDANDLNDSDATLMDMAGVTQYPIVSYMTADSTDHTLDLGLVPPAFDLALNKGLAMGQSNNVMIGEEVVFTITVYNQGGLTATNIDVTDYLPSNTTYSATSSTATGNLTSTLMNTVGLTNNGDGTFTLDALVAGDNVSFDVAITIGTGATGRLTNNAEIVDADGGVDEDSPLTMVSGASNSVTELATNDDINDDGTGTPGTMDNAADEDDWDLEQVMIAATCEFAITGITFQNCTETAPEVFEAEWSITVDYSNPPAGDLIYERNNEVPVTVTPTGSPFNFTIPNIPADGGVSDTIRVYFSNDNSCGGTTIQKRPVPCPADLTGIIPGSCPSEIFSNTTSGTLAGNQVDCTTTLERTFTVGSSITIFDLDVNLNVSHNYRGNVGLTLTSPQGTSVELITRISGNFYDNFDLRLDDESTGPINNGSNDNTGIPIYDADRSAQPANPLSAFDGEEAMGLWTMSFCNLSIGGNPNDRDFTFNSAELVITPTVGCVNGVIPAGESCTDIADTEIKGSVWEDLNFDGIINENPVEGVQGVQVIAYDCDNNIVGTTFTDGSGNYQFSGLMSSEAYRVEFTLPESVSCWAKPTIGGGDNGTSIQFVQPGSCASYGISNPVEFCDDPIQLIANCYLNGQTVGDALVSWNAANRGSNENSGYTMPTHEATNAQIGATWGLDYSNTERSVYVSSFLKRHSSNPDFDGNGEGDLGNIFKISADGDETNNGSAPVWLNLDGAIDSDGNTIDVGFIEDDISRGVNVTGGGNSIDATSFFNIGRVGLGDLDLSENEDAVWVTNLWQNTLHRIAINTDGSPGPIQTFDIPVDNCNTYNQLRLDVGDNTGSIHDWGGDGYFLDDLTTATSADAVDIIAPNAAPESVYQSTRSGTTLNYLIPVPNGNYTIRLHFVESTFTMNGQRVFDIALEGNTVLSNYDIHATVGHDVADPRDFTVSIVDGLLAIDLTASVDDAVLSGIEILPLDGQIFSDARSFALEVDQGTVYLGLTCTGEYSQDINNARAYVYTRPDDSNNGNFSLLNLIDPADSQTGIALNYDKGQAWTFGDCGTPNWLPWIVKYPELCHSQGPDFYVAPQPLLSDIEVDEDGALVFGFIDRWGHQVGFQNSFLNGTTPSNENISGGDILRASFDGVNTYTLENNGSVGGLTGGVGNNQGPGGGEFYSGDLYLSDGGGQRHQEIMLGGLALLEGTGQVVGSAFDPIDGDENILTGGVRFLSNVDGENEGGYILYDAIENSAFFGKAAGLADLDYMCAPAPLEIGNYVWCDSIQNGLQDACEHGIDDMTVQLYDAAGTLVGLTTTMNGGQYYFNTTNVDINGVNMDGTATVNFTGPDYSTQYYIVFGDGQFATDEFTIAGISYEVTPFVGAGSNANIDSDVDGTSLTSGSLGSRPDGLPFIDMTTAATGCGDHKYDLGLTCPVFDLALNKALATGQNGTVSVGDEVVFTITIYNQGTGNATNIDVTDYIPTNMMYSATSSTASSNLTSTLANTVALTNNGNGAFTLDALAAGDDVSFDIALTAGATATGTLTNNAEIVDADGGIDEDTPLTTISGSSDSVTELATNDDIDDDGAGTPGTMDNAADEDDWDLEQVTVQSIFDLALIKVVNTTATPGPFASGDAVQFTITVTNQGSLDAFDVDVADYFVAAELSTPTLVAQAGITDNGGGTFTIDQVTAGNSVTFEVTATIDAAFMGTSITNNAEITGGSDTDGGADVTDEDSTPNNNSGTAPETGNDDVIVDMDDGSLQDDDSFEDDFDPAVVPVGQIFDLALIKTVTSTGPYAPGDAVTFGITVTNQGSLDAFDVDVADYFIAAELSTPTLVAQAGITDNGGGTFTIDQVTAGNSVTFEVTATIDAAFMGTSITNNAEITGGSDTDGGADVADEDSTPNNNSATAPETGNDDVITDNDDGSPQDDDVFEDDFDPAVVPVGQIFDLALIKTVTSTGPYAPGDAVTFGITVTNQGSLDAFDVDVADYFVAAELSTPTLVAQAGITDNGGGTFTIDQVTAGNSVTFEVTATIDAAFMGTSITNNAEITGGSDTDGGADVNDEDSTPNNNSATAPETGNDDVITDNDDGSPQDDDAFEDDFDPAVVPVGQIFDLALIKTVTSTGPYAPGDAVTFGITVTNQGTLDAFDVDVADYFVAAELSTPTLVAQAGVTDNGSGTFTIDQVTAGNSVTFEVTATIDAAFMGTSITNNAEITGGSDTDGGADVTDDDSTPNNNSGTAPETANDDVIVDMDDGSLQDDDSFEDDFDPAVVPVGQIFDLALIKTVTSTGPYAPGDAVTFGITVTNQGSLDAFDVDVADYFVAAELSTPTLVVQAGITDNGGGTFTIDQVTTGNSVTFEVTATIDAAFMGTSITNNAEITGGSDTDGGADVADEDSTPNNNSMTAPETANDDVIVDMDDGSLQDDDSFEDDFDPAVVPVGQIFDLALIKTVTSTGPYAPGDAVTFGITVTNQGSLDAFDVDVADYFVAAELSTPTLVVQAGVIDNGSGTFTIDEVTAGNSVTFEVTATIDAAFMGSSITNNAEITGASDTDGGADVNDEDSTPNNNSATAPETGNDDVIVDNDDDSLQDDDAFEDDFDPAVVPVGQIFDLALIKTVTSTGPYAPGDAVTFGITVTNQGSLDAFDVDVADYFVAAELSTPTLVVQAGVTDNGSGTFTIDEVTAGNSVTFEVTATIDAAFMGTSITNNAEITGGSDTDGGADVADEDSTPNNNSTTAPETGNDDVIVDNDDGSPQDDDAFEDDFDPAVVPVGQIFDLALIKTVTSTGPYAPGDAVTFGITVTNQGSLDAFDVDVADYFVAAELSIPTLVAQAGVTDNGGGTFTIDQVTAGNSVTFEVTATIDAAFVGSSLTNNAEITGGSLTDGGPDEPDVDSTPNNNSGTAPETSNDNVITDNDNGSPQDDDPFEDDFDPAMVFLVSPDTYSLGSTIFEDLNNNGLQDSGESGIGLVQVELYDGVNMLIDIGPDGILGTADDNMGTPYLANTSGNYLFQELPAGTYQVQIPAGAFGASEPLETINISSTPTDTVDNEEDGDDNGSQAGGAGTVVSSPLISLGEADGEPTGAAENFQGGTADDVLTDENGDMTVDFGFFAPVSLGGTTFVDTNMNGLQDNGEPPLEGVTVTLYDSDGNPVTIDAEGNPLPGTTPGQTTTDTDGFYQFTNLPPGDYYVIFDITTVAGSDFFDFTTNTGGVEADDSDADPATGQTDNSGPIPSGGNIPDLDAGVVCNVSAEAGVGQTLCSSAVVELANLNASFTPMGVTATDGTPFGATWTSSGDGTFNNGTGRFDTATTYTPGASDIANGQVILTLTTDDPSMAPFDAMDCGPAMDEVLIIILKVDCGTFPWDGN